MAASVVTLGETMVLFWPDEEADLEGARRYERSFGGAESNFAIALSRLGHGVRWISRLGDDPFGHFIARELSREGVEVIARIDREAPTAVFFKERVKHGPRRVYYYRRGSAASRLAPDDLHPEHFAGAEILHLTGITPALAPSCAAAVDRAIDLARTSGARVSVDANIRLRLWPDANTARVAARNLMARADIALLGHEDAEVVFPGLADEEVLEALGALGLETAVLKKGAAGAVAYHGVEHASVEAIPVQVVDTVGAGDGFDAGFVAGLLRGFPLDRCLELGARVGAAAVKVAGDWEGYPTAEELDLPRIV